MLTRGHYPAALVTAALAMTVVAAASCNNTTILITCGPGTTLKGNECVVAGAGGAGVGGAGAGAGGAGGAASSSNSSSTTTSSSGSSSSSSSSSSSGSGGDCLCADPNASCACGSSACVNGSCSAIQACPTGYVCENNQCICNDVMACGQTCGAAGGTCCAGYVCSPKSRCEPAPVCSIDAHCPSGQRCLDSGTCASPGAGAVGSSCSSGSQCVSLACTTQTCVQTCRAQKDCSGGLLCVDEPMFFSGDVETAYGICILESACSPACAATEFCMMQDPNMGSCQTACMLNQDCANGKNCVYERIGIQGVQGICASGATCNPNEAIIYDGFYVVNNTPSMQCTQLQICSTAMDCPSAYPYCAVVGSTSGMCGRAP